MRSVHVYFFTALLSFRSTGDAFLQPGTRPFHKNHYARQSSSKEPAVINNEVGSFSLKSSSTETPSKQVNNELGEELNKKLFRLCRNESDLDGAMRVLYETEEAALSGKETEGLPNESSYVLILQSIANSGDLDNRVEQAEELFDRMKQFSQERPEYCKPTAYSYSALILIYSRAFANPDSGRRCNELIDELWSLHNSTGDKDYVPFKSTYVSTMAAWSRCGLGKEGAEQAEDLLEEMEDLRNDFPSLNAWSKSGYRWAFQRCEKILQRMEDLYAEGRSELQPNTTSFNTVIDALAQSQQRDSARKAEDLLRRMDELSKQDLVCRPDQYSFNMVLNAWANAREPGAANRAEAILRHMEKRHALNRTNVEPGAATYTTVMNAWARSRDKNAALRAEQVLERMEKSFQNGNPNARPNALSYNTIVNAWAKSKLEGAVDRALETMELMKKISTEEDRKDCSPDVYTYTSLIDAFAKECTPEAAEKADSLLEELETCYRRSGDIKMKPNIRTYTSVINAIGRSRCKPERAVKIVKRLEESGDTSLQPDVVCYNALLNAIGWSTEKGKSRKAVDIFEHMLDSYKSGVNEAAKPDIITCNSVLNACAFEEPESDTQRAKIMHIAVHTLEEFQSAAPTFGFPNHITYGTVLLAISRHMPMGDKRLDLAEATFWQCCRSGNVSAIVVKHLQLALTWKKFESIMGPALLSKEGHTLRFNLRKLPHEWKKFAPKPQQKRVSRPSKKAFSGAVTKASIMKEKKLLP